MCFNPYFPGVTFQSEQGAFNPKIETGFNPYFPGVTFQRLPGHQEGAVDLRFQSLFSWSYLSKKFLYPLHLRTLYVSILIFLELPFKE